MRIDPPIKIDDYDLAYIEVGQYDNGTTAVLIRTSEGEPAMKPSVNLVEHAHMLAPGEFFLKTWSENAVSTAMLLDRGIIEYVPDKRPVLVEGMKTPIVRLKNWKPS